MTSVAANIEVRWRITILPGANMEVAGVKMGVADTNMEVAGINMEVADTNMEVADTNMETLTEKKLGLHLVDKYQCFPGGNSVGKRSDVGGGRECVGRGRVFSLVWRFDAQ